MPSPECFAARLLMPVRLKIQDRGLSLSGGFFDQANARFLETLDNRMGKP